MTVRRSTDTVTRLLMSRCVAQLEQFSYMGVLLDEQIKALERLEKNLQALEPRVLRLLDRKGK